MRLEHATWQEVAAYLERSDGIILPTGSTEQHGPMGLIGTDTICAGEIANRAGEAAGALVAPAIGWTPAPFNMAFPGTISVTEDLFEELLRQIVQGLRGQGFRHFYVLNGHGANLVPLKRLVAEVPGIRVKSWWDFEAVNKLRAEYYSDWEGMHATPSEIAITQATHRTVAPGDAAIPPRKLSKEYIAEHSGDRHGPPDAHRAEFPDGRVGSHSALATAAHGMALLEAAALSVSEDYKNFLSSSV